MPRLAAVAALAVLATAVSANAYYAPKCRAEGEKCKGAEGYKAVEWIDCCDGLSCETPAADWGYVCGPPPKTYAPKCRAEGEKCKGAKGYAAVDWIDCCDGMSCDTPAADWGYVCGRGKAYKAEPVPEKKYAPQCRPRGEKCIGAAGYDAVEWIKCCDDLPCEKPAKDYGFECGRAPKTYAPTTTVPKCLEKDAQCGEGYEKCCDGHYCDEDTSKYGYAYATCQPNKCVDEKGACGDGYDPCCEGYSCEKDGYNMVCMAPVKY